MTKRSSTKSESDVTMRLWTKVIPRWKNLYTPKCSNDFF